LQIAAQASAEAVELARLRYSNGVDSFLNVLDAERQLLELQDQLAQSETETGLALVALYKALGGGWEDIVAEENQN
jgi:multidrug efflux system outer membrane protein